MPTTKQAPRAEALVFPTRLEMAGGVDMEPAPSAKVPRRSRAWVSLLAVLLLPGLLASAWLWGAASDQYVSEFRFAVRRQAPPRADMPSIASALSGANNLMALLQDSEMVVQYLRSRQVIDDLRPMLQPDSIWSRSQADWLSSMVADAPVERQLRYWRRMVVPYLDMNNGIVIVQVWAFTPEDAVRLATHLQNLSERLVNELSRRSQQDALRHARAEVAEADATLRDIRLSMAAFRNANALLTPTLSANVVTQVETRLRESLAEMRAQLAAQLATGTNPTALQVRVQQARIASLEGEVGQVRAELSRPPGPDGDVSLATLLTQYASNEVEERMAQQRLERAQLMLSNASAELARQGVYLNAFVQPALAEQASWPIRWALLAQLLAGLAALWALGLLVWRMAREHAS